MADSNKITVDGRVGKDAELKVGVGGKKDYAKFSVASDREDGGTDWYNVTAFGGLAHLCGARIRKGDEVRVKGRLSVREYTRTDGGVGSSNDLIVDEVVMEGGVKLDKFTPPASGEVRPASGAAPTGGSPDDEPAF